VSAMLWSSVTTVARTGRRETEPNISIAVASNRKVTKPRL